MEEKKFPMKKKILETRNNLHKMKLWQFGEKMPKDKFPRAKSISVIKYENLAEKKVVTFLLPTSIRKKKVNDLCSKKQKFKWKHWEYKIFFCLQLNVENLFFITWPNLTKPNLT